jgi:hypothetical protein
MTVQGEEPAGTPPAGFRVSGADYVPSPWLKYPLTFPSSNPWQHIQSNACRCPPVPACTRLCPKYQRAFPKVVIFVSLIGILGLKYQHFCFLVISAV